MRYSLLQSNSFKNCPPVKESDNLVASSSVKFFSTVFVDKSNSLFKASKTSVFSVKSHGLMLALYTSKQQASCSSSKYIDPSLLEEKYPVFWSSESVKYTS